MALEPITRQEKIIAGKDLQPVTRMEFFLKAYGGGGSGGGAQPDWNQNDDTAPDYVKNRPFYEEKQIVTVENVSGGKMEGFPIFAIGDTVTVTVDGVEHSLVAYDDDGFTIIGDSSINVDNGEGQFGWLFFVQTSVQTNSVHFYAKEAHTVSYLAYVYHTIDAKYLPENIATKSEVEVAQNKANAAQNTASAARSTANTAKSTAEAAQSTANTAKTTADAAKTTAETAQTTANSAKNLADAALAPSRNDSGTNACAYHANNPYDNDAQVYFYIGGTSFLRILVDKTSSVVKINPPVNMDAQADFEFSRLTSAYPHPKIKGIGGIVMHSSTSGSDKQFLITVDDSGTLSATEVT